MKGNKRKMKSIYIALIMVLANFVLFSNFAELNAAPQVDFRIESIIWGTSPDNTITPAPGSTNVPLTITVRNLSNNTLRGVSAELELGYPFVDYITESNISRATGQPVESGDVFNQTGDILPAGSFTLTFRLNIDIDATKGVYRFNMTLTYLVNVNGTFVVGIPKQLEVPIRLPNRAPQILTTTPTGATVNLVVGDNMTFSAKCKDPDNDTLSYEWRFDDEVISTEENFTYVATENDVGQHTLELRVSDGNLTASNTWQIAVSLVPNTIIIASTDYIYGGYRNHLVFNITNNIWYQTVNIYINVPQDQPIAIIGNTTWILRDLSPDEMVRIEFDIYVPASGIGMSLPLGFTINYNDRYGNSYSENKYISFIIRGKIVLSVYGIQVSPQPAKPGDKLLISGSILNSGNIVSLFTNVSIYANPILDLTYESYSYIGDIDADTTIPFTVFAIIKSNATNGTYPVTINISYSDDLYEEHNFNLTVYITVLIPTSGGEENQTSQGQDLNEFMMEGGWVIIPMLIVAIAGVIFYRKKKSE